jgi:hypothetical protein
MVNDSQETEVAVRCNSRGLWWPWHHDLPLEHAIIPFSWVGGVRGVQHHVWLVTQPKFSQLTLDSFQCHCDARHLLLADHAGTKPCPHTTAQ